MRLKEKLRETFGLKGELTLINKYTIAVFCFLVWITFFDRYNLMNQYSLSQNVNLLENKKKDYEDLLEKVLVDRKEINNNIEKYGRENYYFHKDNEEIIIIKENN